MNIHRNVDALRLFPKPQRINLHPGYFTLVAGSAAAIDPVGLCAHPTIQTMLRAGALTAAADPNAGAKAAVRMTIGGACTHRQGYHLEISAAGVTIIAADEAGLTYGARTLASIIAQCGRHLPHLLIEDWPAMENRGFYLDVSRGKVPRFEKLENIVGWLAELRYNEFQLYVENVFDFAAHPEFYADTTPLTADEIRRIDRLSAGVGIDFVPSLTSLGHFDKILRLPRYRHLAEIEPVDLPALGITPWCSDPWTLSVSSPAARALLAEMYDEFLPHFSSRKFNICCDEPWDLALGRSRAFARQLGGVPEAYLEWINYCAGLAGRHNKTVALWGDIIVNHPEKISALPSDALLLEWGYEADHPFDQRGALFAKGGRPWYVCPGTSSWQSLGGRIDTALANIRSAVDAAIRHSAAGLLLTDWGDHGHQQCLIVSMIPLVAAALLSWNPQTTDEEILEYAGQWIAGEDGPCVVRVLFELGTIHRVIARELPRNSSLDFRLFREPLADKTYLNMLNPDSARGAFNTLHRLEATIGGASLRQMHPHLKQGLYISLEMAAVALGYALRRLGAEAPAATVLSARVRHLADAYHAHWHRWNKPSRWIDIQAWFEHLDKQISV